MNIKDNSFLSPLELSRHLGVSRQTIYRWKKEGCPVEMQGERVVRYNLEKIVEWVNCKNKGGA
tara:strand:+ start:1302 stop:1490 length:189 start_codon:yes stop_codon:yes gene_type:complete